MLIQTQVCLIGFSSNHPHGITIGIQSFGRTCMSMGCGHAALRCGECPVKRQLFKYEGVDVAHAGQEMGTCPQAPKDPILKPVAEVLNPEAPATSPQPEAHTQAMNVEQVHAPGQEPGQVSSELKGSTEVGAKDADESRCEPQPRLRTKTKVLWSRRTPTPGTFTIKG